MSSQFVCLFVKLGVNPSEEETFFSWFDVCFDSWLLKKMDSTVLV